ncbi:hypothetical protein [Puia dinghuensis]|nr:hypothetical protein [Puia dinghuensis]
MTILNILGEELRGSIRQLKRHNVRMKYLLTTCLLLGAFLLHAQDAPNLANLSSFAGNTEQQYKLGSVPVNIYTGSPNVSVPIYNYSNAGSGLSWPVSLSYFAGGAQLGETSSTVGLGWYFNSTGVITRTVRGMPDDLPTNGFLYSAAVPTDFRSNGSKFYFDSLDAQQDVFEFNFGGRNGQFLIGKGKEIVQLPNTKMNISYLVSSGDNSTIISFRIVTEDGVKYDFANRETTDMSNFNGFVCGYSGVTYGSAWWLTDIIAPFSADTIKFTYNAVNFSSTVNYPQYTYTNYYAGAPSVLMPTASSSVSSYKLNSIVFPDKRTLQVIYSNVYNYAYGDAAVAKIKISDSVFRYGFALGYTTATNGPAQNLYLSSVTPYTAGEEQKGYTFFYNSTFVPYNTTDFYQKDYWGFYNGATGNSNLIPPEGNSYDANRSPNITYAVYNTLQTFYLPGGGYIHYQYELNDHYPLVKTVGTAIIQGSSSSTSTSASFNQVFGTKQGMVFTLDPSVSRSGSAPVSGNGSITISVQNSSGTITYVTTTFSLYDLFYLGTKTWSFNIPNGAYTLVSQLSSGTSVSGSFPIDVSWENRAVDGTKTAVTAGGLRVKRVTRQDDIDDPNITTEDFQYFTVDGKSSGFLGDTAAYSHPYTETVINGGTTTTNYNYITSDPTNTLDYTQGSPVGYSRVIVYKGSSTHNLGKTVYEFTGPADVNCNISTHVFPYTPQDMREWGMGLPTRVSLYDSLGNLVKRTVNTYEVDTVAYSTSDFLSLELGNTFTQINGAPSNPASPRTKTFVGQQYYPSSGRAFVIASTDTLYQSDGSVNTIYRNYVYDTNYNVTKMITSYDRTRGLQLESRYYYPYNYIITGPIGTMRTSGILSPVIATENWITGDANPRMIGGSITDYQQLSGGYIKPLTSYALQSNAPVVQSVIGLFDSSKLNRNSTYFVAQASYPNYSSKGNLLQVTSAVSGQSTSTIRDYNDEYAVASVSNAANGDVAYTSFESDGSGNWTIGNSTRDYSGALTGKWAYNLSNGNVTKSGLNTALTYIVSVWAKTSASVSVNGTAQSSPLAQQNGWNLYFTMVGGVSTVTISGSGTIDELRLYPKDANMATTTYEPLVGPTTSCDANSTVQYTTYDLLNRPKLIKDKDGNVIRRFDYSDKDSLISTAPVWSRTAVFQWDPVYQCGYDSVITTRDVNPWSDSYNYATVQTVFEGYNYCTCSYSANYPQWKTINGVCTQGAKQYSSCVYYKTGNYYLCTYHYIWPDCSVSQNYTEQDATAQTVSSSCPPPGGFP